MKDPDLGFAGRVHETQSKIFAPPIPFLKPNDNPGHAGCLFKPRDSAARIRVPAVSPHRKETL
jgi:hypothetical protein